MPGKQINDYQVRIFMEHCKQHSISQAAVKSGFSPASGYRVNNDPQRQSAKAGTRRRRRPDPLDGIYEQQIVPMLKNNPKLRAVAVYEKVVHDNPHLSPGIRRTVERRVRDWKANHGPDQEVFFTQRYEPGRWGISDFTSMNKLEVTIGSQPLNHLVYHFRLPWSGFQYASAVLSGESFEALAEGLQNALWTLGGAPRECRTDSLSAAYRNLNSQAAEDLTRRYENLCAHYGMLPTRNNRGEAHENGAIESSHGHLKRRIEDALLLRGSRDFDIVDEYGRFISKLIGMLNTRRAEKIDAERAVLTALPAKKACGWRDATVTVTRTGGFVLDKVFYTVPSRLIGNRLQVRIYNQHLQIYQNGTHQFDVQRLARSPDGRRRHVIDYRHIIHSLKCKPMAMLNWVHRDGLFPCRAYRLCFEKAIDSVDSRSACRLTVNLLALAHERNCERRLGVEIQRCLNAGQLPDLKRMRELFEVDHGTVPAVKVAAASLDQYASLLERR